MKHFITLVAAITTGIFVGHGTVFIFSVFTDTVTASTQIISEKDTEVVEKVNAEEIEKNTQPSRYATAKDISIKTSGYNFLDHEKVFLGLDQGIFIISDLETGEVLNLPGDDEVRENILREDVRSIASITKLMTALVSIDNFDQNENIKITWEAEATYGKQGGLSTGEVYSLEDMLNILLLTSSNDGAEALARAYVGGRDEFMSLMNEKAQSIGMENTFFDDPSGLSAKNVSSLSDLSTLVTYINKNYPEILEITGQKSYKAKGRTWFNNSKFRNDDNYYGGKNGYTDAARQTLVSVFELPIGLDDEIRKISIVLLGSEKSESDMREIVLYLLQNVEYVPF